VKIKVFHDVCGREILVQQILESGGHCPWDGKAFTGDYTALLAEALEMAESAGSVLEIALDQIAGMKPTFTIERESLIDPLEQLVERLSEGKKAVRR
jgi:hypothetical protein